MAIKTRAHRRAPVKPPPPRKRPPLTGEVLHRPLLVSEDELVWLLGLPDLPPELAKHCADLKAIFQDNWLKLKELTSRHKANAFWMDAPPEAGKRAKAKRIGPLPDIACPSAAQVRRLLAKEQRGGR